MKRPFSFWNNAQNEALPPLQHGSETVSAIIGWAGIRIMDNDIDLLELCHEYCKAVEHYSCGQCIPCRVGSRVITGVVGRMKKGNASKTDLDTLREIAETMSLTSMCELGRSSPRVILHLIDQHEEALKQQKKVTPREDGAFVYHSLKTAPCIQACPIHLDIPKYIEEIKSYNFEASLGTIRERLPLPGVLGRVCVRPCEFNCRRGLIDEPLQIKHLKRFAADHGRSLKKPALRKKGLKKNKQKIAIIGSGPAGLTAAHFLAGLGYPVTIFEMLTEPGGMAAVGIPDYRLPREILRDEIRTIEDSGVTIVYGKALGASFSLDDLQAEGFRAVFIGMGCHCHKSMGVEGEDKGYYGYVPGVYFLRNINLGLLDEVPRGRKIVVVGGGNVAIDCVRIALRIGFEEAHLVYRRTKKEMPADAVEVADAEAEGVQFHFLTAPKKILAEDKKVRGIECLAIELGEPDATGRRRPVEVAGSDFVVDADVVVAAIGQEGDFACFCNLPGVDVTEKGAIVINENFMTTRDGVFSGGDCVTGPDVVIRACAHGRMSAMKIDHYLEHGEVPVFDEQKDELLLARLRVYDPHEKIDIPGGLKRIPVRHEPPADRRRDFREVDHGYTDTEAVAEASRCLRCYRVLLYACRKSGAL
ncbi:MAG: FAD-dependent oxidoreductase [Nitrospirae bacterium]|nr:FAD-dependent oxidoreductase [Nitrospirota bacterium]